MTELINNYTHSFELVKQRIAELHKMRTHLVKNGGESCEVNDLDRRIRLLYTEYEELKAVISHLTSYNRRTEGYGKKQ
ncbi:MAG: hypothetical protein K6G33_14960 [Ruminococcus sp.]|uniref:hypothetical protein n=1 Tax=Ruminococcus sp. TaxID=41978 RepID=UPI0025E63314|nr:hypothetical protein [Ruminococcus sp.]MCR5602025.1 hypothetical protein [Ruminococcus sp.]